MENGYTYKRTDGEEELITVKVEISPERLKEETEHVYEHLAADIKIQGFRPGKAPRHLIEQQLGAKLFSETVNHALPHIASEIVEREELSPVTGLSYEVQDFTEAGGLTFEFTFTNYPKIELGDLSKLKVKRIAPDIADAEVEEVVQRLLKDKDTNKDTPLEVTDELAAGLDIDGIKTAADLRARIRAQLEGMKNESVERDYRNRLIDAAITASNIKLPDALINEQAEDLIESYMSRIKELGVETEKFMEAQGLTPEKLREQKRAEAKAKLSADFLLNEIVRKYELAPKPEEIENELNSISDPELRETYDSYQGRRHILSVLIQQKGLQKLQELAANA